MTEDELCPNCRDPYTARTVQGAKQDFSVAVQEHTLEKVCVFHVRGESWVYIHVTESGEHEEEQSIAEFFCHMCSDDVGFEAADDIVEHMVEVHEMEREQAEREVEMLEEMG